MSSSVAVLFSQRSTSVRQSDFFVFHLKDKERSRVTRSLPGIRAAGNGPKAKVTKPATTNGAPYSAGASNSKSSSIKRPPPPRIPVPDSAKRPIEETPHPATPSFAPVTGPDLKPPPGAKHAKSSVPTTGNPGATKITTAKSSAPTTGNPGATKVTTAKSLAPTTDKKIAHSQSAAMTDAEVAAAEEQMSAPPSCPVPNFMTTATSLTLLDPVKAEDRKGRPLLVYLPGMDCTGQTVTPQISYLYHEGYDIRSLYLPSSDRSTWQEIVDSLLPLIKEEALLEKAAPDGSSPAKYRNVTILAESFGGVLALLVANAAPELITRLVLVNPATNFRQNNFIISLAAASGLLRYFPDPLYEAAQNIMLPWMVKRNRVTRMANKDLLSPIDFVPPATAAWRFNMLNDGALSETQLAQIKAPTLLVAAAKDRVLPSLTEAARLQKHIPNSQRVVLPESGHTALLEDNTNIVDIMHRYGFSIPRMESGEVLSEAAEAPVPAPIKHAVADEVYDEMGRILEPWRVLTSPLISGAENLPIPNATPKRPILFVGNHTIFGLYDSPVLVHELYMRGFRLRGLAHPAHWRSGAGPLFARYGNVKASPRAAYNLLKEGADVLLFPGGANEVTKKKDEKYKLLWKERTDFVRMASKMNALIVPFGALGGDDAFDVMYDGQEVVKFPIIGPLIKELYVRNNVDPSNVYPVTRLPLLPPGIDIPSPLPVPTIERIYFHFAPVIDTADFKCKLGNAEECQKLYKMVKRSVEESIDKLMDVRNKDPERMLIPRLLAKASRLLPELTPRESKP